MAKLLNAQGQAIPVDPWAAAVRCRYPEGWSGTETGIVLEVANTFAIREIPAEVLQSVDGIALEFPAFTDGRAYSQARELRQRGFAGDIRATGDVLADQLLAMRRCGFSSFVLVDGQSWETATRALRQFEVAAQSAINDDGLRHRSWESRAPQPQPEIV